MVTHLSAEELEAYSLSRTGPDVDRPIEEHLLSCELCQDRLFGEDVTTGAIRAAFRFGKAAANMGELESRLLEMDGDVWIGRIDSAELRSLRRLPLHGPSAKTS